MYDFLTRLAFLTIDNISEIYYWPTTECGTRLPYHINIFLKFLQDFIWRISDSFLDPGSQFILAVGSF